jgi:hypothetical protein
MIQIRRMTCLAVSPYDPPTKLEIAEAAAHIAFCERPWGDEKLAWTKAHFALIEAEGMPTVTRCPACHVIRRGNAGDCRHCGAVRPGGVQVTSDPTDYFEEIGTNAN